MEKKEKREKEKRGLVPSPQIIMMICKSILIFLHHTFHKHKRHILIVLSDHLAEFRPPLHQILDPPLPTIPKDALFQVWLKLA